MKKLIFVLMLFSLSASAQFNPGKYELITQIVASDPDSGPEIVFSITAGNWDHYFIILPCSGSLLVDTIAYSGFVRQRTWNIKIKVADPEGNFVKSTRKITLRKNSTGSKLSPIVITEQ